MTIDHYTLDERGWAVLMDPFPALACAALLSPRTQADRFLRFHALQALVLCGVLAVAGLAVSLATYGLGCLCAAPLGIVLPLWPAWSRSGVGRARSAAGRIAMRDTRYTFGDERFMTAQDKRRVLRAWQRFIRSGFEHSRFSPALYRFLINHCSFIAHYSREGFWGFYFNGNPDDFFRLINQFGGDRRSSEYGGSWWQGGPTGADLKAAMCREMELVFDALVSVMDMAAPRLTGAQRRKLAQAVRPAFEARRRLPQPGFGRFGLQLSLWDTVRVPEYEPPERVIEPVP